MSAPITYNASTMGARRISRYITDYNNPASVGSRLRARRSRNVVALLEQIHSRQGHVSVIDIGGTGYYWNSLPGKALDRYDVRVTVVNLPGESNPIENPRFTFTEGNGCDLNWVTDRQFDLAISNSVLEHVGRWPQMKAFALEVRRVATAYYVQTPYFWFPVEPHYMTPFFHWIPEPVAARLMCRFSNAYSSSDADWERVMLRIQSAKLVDRRSFAVLFPDAEIHFEKLAGLPKSLMGIRRMAQGPSAR